MAHSAVKELSSLSSFFLLLVFRDWECVMTSPLVNRLLSDLRSCTDSERRALIEAELACYYSRAGEYAQAEQAIKALRRDYGDGRSAPVSIMIMCAESLLMYYTDLSPQARDRMLRANLLSGTFGLNRLKALTAAWMAHIDFNLGRMSDMTADLDACFQSDLSDDALTLGRAAIVLGDAFLFAGKLKASRAWYDRANRAAVALGDQAAIGAIAYNRAALHVSGARLRALWEALDRDELSLIGMEVQSACNYQSIAQIKSLDHLLVAARIGVLMLKEEYLEAEREINQLLASGALGCNAAQTCLLRSDLYYCRMLRGELEDVRDWIVSTISNPKLIEDSDDRAVIFNNAALVAKAAGLNGEEAELIALKADAISVHRATIGALDRLIAHYENSAVITGSGR